MGTGIPGVYGGELLGGSRPRYAGGSVFRTGALPVLGAFVVCLLR